MAPACIAVVTSWHAAIGTSGSRHRLCTVTSDIDESMRTSNGGGVECVWQHQSLVSHRDASAWPCITCSCCCSEEAVEVLALPLNSSERFNFFHDDACPKSGGLCFALHWLVAPSL